MLIGPLQATCESTPWCTVDCAYGPCANQTDCEAAGACDDAELTNPLLYRNVTTGDPFDPMYRFPFFLGCASVGKASIADGGRHSSVLQ